MVLAVALAVRLWGIGWQLPAALYFDEMKYVERAGATVRGQPRETVDFRNPTLFRHFLEVEYRLVGLFHPDAAGRPLAVFQLAAARVTSAVFGAVACLLTGLAAARLATRALPGPGSDWVGPAAGLILALAPLHVHLSHYAVNDAPASLLLATGLLFGARALVSPNSRDFLAAGVLAGLAAATKYNFGVVVALPVVAAVGNLTPLFSLTPRPPLPAESAPPPAPLPSAEERGNRLTGHPSPASRERGLHLLLTLGGFAVGMLVGMPEVVLSPVTVLAGIAEQARLGTQRWNGQSPDPIWLLYGEALVRGLGWPVLAMALAGIVALGQRDRLALAGLLSVPVAYLAIMLRQELFFARFALPLLLPLVMLAGVGTGALASVLVPSMGGRRGTALVVAGLVTVLLPAAWTTVQHNRLATTTDTRILAQRWLDENAAGARAVTEVYGLPISWTGGAPPSGYRLQRVAALVDPTLVRRLACDGVRYFVTASLTVERERARRAPTSDETGYDLLSRIGRRAATFDPFRPGMMAPAHPDDTGIPFWHLGAYARPGPSIAVYEVPEGTLPDCPSR
jgi:4-amino-4-deoxy-L-arabinose transferase-like glycosyltransferase